VTLQNGLETVSKVGYFFYWFFDSLFILSKIKLIGLDTKRQSKLAMTAWFFGTTLMLVKFIVDLNVLLTQKQKEDPNNRDKSLDLKILNTYLNILGKIGDLFPSGKGSEIFLNLLGKTPSDTAVGFGGLVASLVALYNAWSKA